MENGVESANVPELKEHSFMELDSSSTDSSTISNISDDNNSDLNLKEIKLSLGLPGSQSLERDKKQFLVPQSPKDRNYSPLHKRIVSSNKRRFFEAVSECSKRQYVANYGIGTMSSTGNISNLSDKSIIEKNKHGTQLDQMNKNVPRYVSQERTYAANGNSNASTAIKSQVVGWPPVGSFRKSKLATNSTKSNEIEKIENVSGSSTYVKVRMDGAPYLRKVNLRTYSTYRELSSVLENMFSCFSIGNYGSLGEIGNEIINESKVNIMFHGSEYVLAYEDKDGDLMLVGDDPWEMFADTCKRLRIMKGPDAISLAPRPVEKC